MSLDIVSDLGNISVVECGVDFVEDEERCGLIAAWNVSKICCS